MNGSLVIRRGLLWTVGALAAVIVAVLMLAAALNAGYLRGPLVHFFSVLIGRPIQVAGPLRAQVFSLNPQLIAERVSIGNPPWTPSGLTAQIGKLTLVFEIPSFSRSFAIERLEMEAATLHLIRDSAGHANWQRTDPDRGKRSSLPLIRSLSVPDARVVLDDARRHLQFDGTVSIQDVEKKGGPVGPLQLHIDGAGELNGKAATFEITGDPLATMSRERPYHFEFAERSTGSRLSVRGSLPPPLDVDVLDATFEAAGADLKDMYFLTGVSLLNTGSYRLSGKVARRGTATQFSDLLVTFGQSDVRGTLSIESSSGRAKLDAQLDSQVLRTLDLGLRAAGRGSGNSADPPRILSDAMFNPAAARRSDAVVSFRARRVDVGRVALHAVAARMTIDQGIIKVAPLTASVLGGTMDAHLRLDATTDDPAADFDLKISNAQLGQLDERAAEQPRIEGSFGVNARITGRGRSLHQIAASANGPVTALLSQGAMRASLAELMGIDARSLGLFLTKSRQDTAIRCGVARFQARDGTLTAQSLIVDADPVLITGDGLIHLDSETLDLAFRGHPKSLRILRLRSAILVRGTLSHPSISIDGHDSALVLVDPGTAKDVDCASL
jgi:AsmA family protein